MNYTRLALASLGALVAYNIVGGLAAAVPALRGEFGKYPGVYRPRKEMMSVMPAGMAAMLVAMVALAIIYALVYRGGSGVADGALFGTLIGVFAICSFVIHNQVNLNIGWALTIQQSVVYFVIWIVVGIVMGLIYRPLAIR
jgi:hypothetical protein